MLGGAAVVRYSSPTHCVGRFPRLFLSPCCSGLQLFLNIDSGPLKRSSPNVLHSYRHVLPRSFFHEHMHNTFSLINMVLFLTGGGGCFTDPRCLLACYFASWLWFASSSWQGVALGTASLSPTFFPGILIDVQVITWRGNSFQHILMLRKKTWLIF